MRLFIAIPAIIVCLNISAQKEKYFASRWQDNSTALISSDYTAANKGMLFYCLSNDDKNMYVDVKITESIEQNKFLQMGMTLWINSDGKSKKITGIRYPVGAKYSKLQIGRGEGQGNSILNKVSPLSQANTIELIGFKDGEAKRFPSNNTDNIRGNVKYDSEGNLLYSITIPLAKLPEGVKNSDGAAMPMTIALEYGAPPVMSRQPGGQFSGNAPQSGGGSRSGGRSGGGAPGGGAPGGGAPGGGAPGGGASTQDAPKPVIIWIKNIKLAEKKYE